MSTRELKRAGVLARVKAKTLTLRAAAELMEVSYRQAKRLLRRYHPGRAGPAEPGCGAKADPPSAKLPGPAPNREVFLRSRGDRRGVGL